MERKGINETSDTSWAGRSDPVTKGGRASKTEKYKDTLESMTRYIYYNCKMTTTKNHTNPVVYLLVPSRNVCLHQEVSLTAGECVGVDCDLLSLLDQLSSMLAALTARDLDRSSGTLTL